MSMDSKEIQSLIKFVSKSGVNEVSIEQGEFKITIKTDSGPQEQHYIVQNPQQVQQAPVQVAPPVAAAPIAAAPPAETAPDSAANGNYVEIKSPMIGTFYRKPSPDKDLFVNIGDTINVGDVICVVEAMKLFNEIESEISGKIVDVEKDYNEIISQENPDLKAVEEKVIKILKDVPTFAGSAEGLAGLDPAALRAKLIDISNGNNNETNALKAARDAVAKIGEAPVSEYMTGPYWEMTNVKAAAIVRSKKYSYVDDYEYINAYYEDPLNLDSADREYVEGELKNLLSKDNIKLKLLDTKVSQLSNELNLTKEQSQNLTTEISKLESELSSLKNSEGDLQKQINDLTNQFNSKESLITEKNQNLASIQEQLKPISNRMNDLKGQRVELDTKLNDQLNIIANQIESQGQGTEEANALKTQFENQIAELDNQLKDYENQTVEINNQLTSLTTELSTLETENPEIANQIASLNQDLKNFVNIKADLAMATAKKMGLDVDEQALKSVEILDGKVIVTIEGTELVRVVDEKMLTDQSAKFIDPISKLSINSKIYSSNALKPDLLTQELVKGTYEVAKEVREKATKRLSDLEATPGASKVEIQAAKAASDSAKYAEIAAGQSLVSNANIASASISSQQQTLKALKQVASTPGMNKWNVRRANEAVKAAEAQIAGVNYDYESAINKIANDEQKFNVWRADDYKKEIEAAKASGNAADLKAYTRRLNNFQKRLIDEREAFEAATARTEYFDAISKIIGNNIAKLHLATKNIKLYRKNNLSLQSWFALNNLIKKSK